MKSGSIFNVEGTSLRGMSLDVFYRDRWTTYAHVSLGTKPFWTATTSCFSAWPLLLLRILVMILLITKRPTNADWWKHLGGRTASLDTTRLRCLFGSTASDNMPSGGPDGSVQNLQGITTQQADGSGEHSQAQSNTKNSGSPISSDSPTTILADCSHIFSYAQHDSIPHK